ncbi:MAG TPA: SurA N-terminal domain-containing protein [Methylophilaceae bacterium]|nr:SurA N-terminal domain-containing protein [Methylophilaceae bacterium]
MLEAIRKHTQGVLAKLILALITIPFALWGIDSYLNQAGSSAAIATVDGEEITVQQYGNALQNLRNQLQAEGRVDPALLERPEIKQSVLDRLVTTRLLRNEAEDANFRISDDQLAKHIIGLPEFQNDGQFSQELYDQILAQNRLTPSQFENSMRAELLLQQVRNSLGTLTYAPEQLAQHAVSIEHQQREVSVAEIKTADYLSQVNVTPEEVQAYYEKNKDKFRVPEQVKLEFVMMSANTLIPGMQVSEEEAKEFYQTNAAKFQGSEQRRASHILIGFGVSPTPQAKQEARKKAEQVLADVRKNPDAFAELAKKYSQDPGSAVKGGDLGLFARGAMVKPFEDAVFSMRPGAISDLVESEFGYHIIKLTEIEGQGQTYESVKPQIRAELMYQKALSKFSEQAEDFSNMVYEQSGSLQPAAKAFNLKVQTTDWLSHEEGAKFFKNDRLMDMVFSNEVLQDRRNTEAIEIAPNTLMAARVVDHKPAAARKFEEVKDGIEDYLKLEQATQLAVEKGKAILADLKQGKPAPKLEWIPPVIVDRGNAQGLTDRVMSNVFKINTSKLPAYAGVEDGNKGYLLMKVSKVISGLEADAADPQADKQKFEAALASEYEAAYVESLKKDSKISVNTQLMNAANQ